MLCAVCGQAITNVKTIVGTSKYAHVKCVNTQGYKLVLLDAKVISKSDDKSSVGCEAIKPAHNED